MNSKAYPAIGSEGIAPGETLDCRRLRSSKQSGPCRSAISHNEPYKNDELASDDIICIYYVHPSSRPAQP